MVCKGLVHPNIVELHGVCFDDERPWLVMEYMEGGSLDAYFSARRKKKPGHLRHNPPKPYIKPASLVVSVGAVSLYVSCIFLGMGWAAVEQIGGRLAERRSDGAWIP